jgi:hypothetical protein
MALSVAKFVDFNSQFGVGLFLSFYSQPQLKKLKLRSEHVKLVALDYAAALEWLLTEKAPNRGIDLARVFHVSIHFDEKGVLLVGQLVNFEACARALVRVSCDACVILRHFFFLKYE